MAGRQLPSVACGAVVLRRRRAGGVMARQRRQAVKGRVGQAPWRARAALRVGGEAEALWRTAAFAADGTALAWRAARCGDGTLRRQQLGTTWVARCGVPHCPRSSRANPGFCSACVARAMAVQLLCACVEKFKWPDCYI